MITGRFSSDFHNVRQMTLRNVVKEAGRVYERSRTPFEKLRVVTAFLSFISIFVHIGVIASLRCKARTTGKVFQFDNTQTLFRDILNRPITPSNLVAGRVAIQ